MTTLYTTSHTTNLSLSPGRHRHTYPSQSRFLSLYQLLSNLPPFSAHPITLSSPAQNSPAVEQDAVCLQGHHCRAAPRTGTQRMLRQKAGLLCRYLLSRPPTRASPLLGLRGQGNQYQLRLSRRCKTRRNIEPRILYNNRCRKRLTICGKPQAGHRSLRLLSLSKRQLNNRRAPRPIKQQPKPFVHRLGRATEARTIHRYNSRPVRQDGIASCKLPNPIRTTLVTSPTQAQQPQVRLVITIATRNILRLLAGPKPRILV